MVIPSGKDEHRWMALECARKYLRTFHTETYAIILDSRESGLRNPGALGELILGHVLELANDAHRLSYGNGNALLGRAKLTHYVLR